MIIDVPLCILLFTHTFNSRNVESGSHRLFCHLNTINIRYNSLRVALYPEGVSPLTPFIVISVVILCTRPSNSLIWLISIVLFKV